MRAGILFGALFAAGLAIVSYDAKIELPALTEVEQRLQSVESDVAAIAARVTKLERSEPSVPVPNPDPDPTPISYPEEFKAKAIEYGVRHGEALLTNTNWDKQVANVYYDADWVFFQIAQMTGDERFKRYSDRAYEIYMQYSAQGPAAYYVFTDGLYRRALAGDDNARERILHLGLHGPYIPEATPLEWTAGENRSREVAYALRTLRHAELLGAPRHPKRDALLAQALGHIDQWTSGGTANFAPFMFGITSFELLLHNDQWPDERITSKVAEGVEYTIRVAWRPDDAFCYRLDSPTAHLGSPSLNQFMTPVLGRMARLTDNPEWREIAERCFRKGVQSGFYGGAKQFNQLHANVFDYVANPGVN